MLESFKSEVQTETVEGNTLVTMTGNLDNYVTSFNFEGNTVQNSGREGRNKFNIDNVNLLNSNNSNVVIEVDTNKQSIIIDTTYNANATIYRASINVPATIIKGSKYCLKFDYQVKSNGIIIPSAKLNIKSRVTGMGSTVKTYYTEDLNMDEEKHSVKVNYESIHTTTFIQVILSNIILAENETVEIELSNLMFVEYENEEEIQDLEYELHKISPSLTFPEEIYGVGMSGYFDFYNCSTNLINANEICKDLKNNIGIEGDVYITKLDDISCIKFTNNAELKSIDLIKLPLNLIKVTGFNRFYIKCYFKIDEVELEDDENKSIEIRITNKDGTTNTVYAHCNIEGWQELALGGFSSTNLANISNVELLVTQGTWYFDIDKSAAYTGTSGVYTQPKLAINNKMARFNIQEPFYTGDKITSTSEYHYSSIYTFKGEDSEKWVLMPTNEDMQMHSFRIDNVAQWYGKSRIYCTHATDAYVEYMANTETYVESEYKAWLQTNVEPVDKAVCYVSPYGMYVQYQHSFVIKVPKSIASTVEEFKTFLQNENNKGIPFKVIYEANYTSSTKSFTTEQKEQLKNLQKFRKFGGTSYIGCSNDKDVKLVVTYPKAIGINTINTKLDNTTTDITNIKSEQIVQNTEIDNLKSANEIQDTTSEILNLQLKRQLPNEYVEGTEFHFTDSSDLPITNLVVKGNDNLAERETPSIEAPSDIIGSGNFQDVMYGRSIIIISSNKVTPDYTEEYKQKVYPIANPSKQVLLEGDYLDDEGEHSIWYYLEIDKTYIDTVISRNAVFYSDTYNTFSFGCLNTTSNNILFNNTMNYMILSNYFINTTLSGDMNLEGIEGFVSRGPHQCFNIRNNNCSSKEDYINWLTEIYENGNPLKIFIKRDEELIIPYTQQQQEQWNKLKKLETFKTETYIYSSDCIGNRKEEIISPTLSFTYTKDLELLNKQKDDKLALLEEKIALLEAKLNDTDTETNE